MKIKVGYDVPVANEDEAGVVKLLNEAFFYPDYAHANDVLRNCYDSGKQ
jgi:hypothetical protein